MIFRDSLRFDVYSQQHYYVVYCTQCIQENNVNYTFRI